MRQLTSSQIRPEKPFVIENILNGICTILFFDAIEEFEVVEEDGTTSINYRYYQYRMKDVPYRDNLQDIIQNDIEIWLNAAKEKDKLEVANDVRKKRNALLEESDKEMCIDRLGLPKPEEDTFAAWLPFLQQLSEKLSSSTAKYRQELRDISKQKDFPYNIDWPKEE